jgi:hypothetical protein
VADCNPHPKTSPPPRLPVSLFHSHSSTNGDSVDFDQGSAREGGDLNGAARGVGWAEEATVHLVDRCIVGEVDDVDRRAYDVVEIAASGSKHGSEVFHDSLDLHADVSDDHLAGCWIQWDLSTEKEQAAGAYGLRIWTDGSGGLFG